MGKDKNEQRRVVVLTSRNVPNAALADAEFVLRNGHEDTSTVHEEHHLHLSAVLCAFEAARWDLHHAAAKEGECEELCEGEVCPSYRPGLRFDCLASEGYVLSPSLA